MSIPAQEESESSLSLPFCSVDALEGLNDARPHDEVGSSILSLWIQMTLFQNILTDIPRNNVLPAI